MLMSKVLSDLCVYDLQIGQGRCRVIVLPFGGVPRRINQYAFAYFIND